jgi:hypothetical protein
MWQQVGTTTVITVAIPKSLLKVLFASSCDFLLGNSKFEGV